MGWILFIGLAFVLWVAVSLFGGALVYFGWNYGVLAAFPAHGLGEIGFWSAFFLALFISMVAGMFSRAKKRR